MLFIKVHILYTLFYAILLKWTSSCFHQNKWRLSGKRAIFLSNEIEILDRLFSFTAAAVVAYYISLWM